MGLLLLQISVGNYILYVTKTLSLHWKMWSLLELPRDGQEHAASAVPSLCPDGIIVAMLTRGPGKSCQSKHDN